MDNLIILAIIAISILIIAIFIYMRLKDRAPTTASKTRTPKKAALKPNRKSKDSRGDNSIPNQAVQAEAINNQSVAQASNQPVSSTSEGIDIAQAYINEQRYDEAVHELKLKLKSDPTHSKALLALLNVYALTNNRTEFDKAYSYVQSKADILTLQEAKQLRDSVGYNAPQPSMANTASPQTEPDLASTNTSQLDDPVFSLDDNVNFDETPEPAATPATSLDDTALNTDSDSDFSFDDFNDIDNLDDEKIASTQDTQAVSSTQDNDDAFDFSFDDDILTTTPESPVVEPSAAKTSEKVETSETTTDDDLFDFSFDEVDSESTSAQAPTKTSSELDFDDTFDSEPEQPITDSTTTQSASSDTIDDFAFDFDDEAIDDSASTDNDGVDIDDDFSFDLDPVSEEQNKDTEHTKDTESDFDLFDLDEPSKPDNQKTVELVNEDINDNELIFDDIDLNDNASDSKPAVAENNISDLDIDGLDIDDWDDDVTQTDTPAKESKTVELVNEDISNNELSFDDFDLTTDSLSESTAPEVSIDSLQTDELSHSAKEANSIQTDSFDDFDFVIDDSTADTASKDAQVEDSIDITAPTTSDSTKDLADLEEFSFDSDFDDIEDEGSSKVLEDTAADTQMPSIESQTESQSDDEFVLDWDEPLEEKTTVIQPKGDLAMDDDFSFEDSPTSDETGATVDRDITQLADIESSSDTHISDAQEAPSFDNSGLEDTLAQLDAMSMDDFGSFDIDEPAQPDVTTDKEANALSSEFDFNEQPSTPKQTETAPTTDTDTSTDTGIELRDLIDENKTVRPDAPVQEASKPVSKIDSEFLDTFSFVEDLDKSEITLNLAKQYLELGEYDSAKRLINEVLTTADDSTQKAKAQEMLNRIS